MLVQANVKGAQRPYEQFSYLPFKTWGGYSFDLSPPYYSFYYTVSKLASIWMAVWVQLAGVAWKPQVPQCHGQLNEAPHLVQVPDSLGCDGVKARCILQW